jgi:hypothetical protein
MLGVVSEHRPGALRCPYLHVSPPSPIETLKVYLNLHAGSKPIIQFIKMTQGSKYSGKKVVVFFYREMPRNVTGDESKGLISNLLKIFQDRSRFEIVNGVNELSKLG